jgi:hypothetical protein
LVIVTPQHRTEAESRRDVIRGDSMILYATIHSWNGRHGDDSVLELRACQLLLLPPDLREWLEEALGLLRFPEQRLAKIRQAKDALEAEAPAEAQRLREEKEIKR